jgi:adenine phosphoribosyltransferase
MFAPDEVSARLQARIRAVPDFPKPGILFRDITPLLGDPATLRLAVDALAAPYQNQQIDHIVGIESRGFIFGVPLAYKLDIGFIPVRKIGKLPARTVSVEYALEYGTSAVEVHADAVQPGQRVVIVDDLLATGGTAAATVALMRQLGAQVIGLAFVIELAALGGRERLPGQPIHTLIRF